MTFSFFHIADEVSGRYLVAEHGICWLRRSIITDRDVGSLLLALSYVAACAKFNKLRS